MEISIARPWEYVETFQGIQFYRLYRNPSAALTIFRKSLPSLAKTFVMILLYMPRPLPKADLELLVQPSSVKEYRLALQSLRQYHILKDVRVHSTDAYSLTPEFAASLRQALVGANTGYPFGEPVDVPSKEAVSPSELDRQSQQKWENILGYMVGSVESTGHIAPPSQAVIDLLEVGELIAFSDPRSHSQRPEITQAGFSFVLQDLDNQAWALIFLYAHNAAEHGLDGVDVLSFVLFIAALEPGLAYSRATLEPTQQQVLSLLSALGIVYQPVSSDGNPTAYFYPTRLASTLGSDTKTRTSIVDSTLDFTRKSFPAGDVGGSIIVETNYRVYAYTSSPIQIALLSLFVNLGSRHPNLVTGKITQSSVQRAIQRGISTEQIISYLSVHAHPQMRAARAEQGGRNKTSSALPITVVDQIHLWQLERDRLRTTNGFLLKNFATLDEYEAACGYARDIGALVWKNDEKRMFFVNLNTVDGPKSFMSMAKR